jgi:hypothetical protein
MVAAACLAVSPMEPGSLPRVNRRQLTLTAASFCHQGVRHRHAWESASASSRRDMMMQKHLQWGVGINDLTDQGGRAASRQAQRLAEVGVCVPGAPEASN